jgi:hypothetical protein
MPELRWGQFYTGKRSIQNADLQVELAAQRGFSAGMNQSPAVPARHAPATARNRDPILAAIAPILPARGLLLEISSGTGEHAAFMAPRLPPALLWQPSDLDPANLADIDAHARASGCDRIQAAVLLDAMSAHWPVRSADAILCCNMIHIAPWVAAEGLFAGAARTLPREAPLILYGPFRRDGEHTAPSNAAFDDSLRQRNACWGVRCLDTEVTPLAQRHGFRRDAVLQLPANNLLVVFRRNAA